LRNDRASSIELDQLLLLQTQRIDGAGRVGGKRIAEGGAERVGNRRIAEGGAERLLNTRQA